MDDVIGEEAPARWRTEQGVGFRRGFSRLHRGARLSEMWGKLQKYPHRFEALLSCAGISQEVGVFAHVVISE